ncbi:hypothetical protein FNV43_RR00789 [Rhamnella rubrinervis]|uniref:F-box domain-containing protein n=1 Tax=Rhamnella rubrinervis TaxID=2594499 RepID=A0A8K0MS97_9ROSA|nr:hypothetical protein FNV43_RR00789 [Rhamnella rubrinervis]
MKHLEYTQSYLPDDIALRIASLLQVSDLCALGCCSRFWRRICASDCVWKSLTFERWPCLDSLEGSSSSSSSSSTAIEIPISRGWKFSYIKRHNETADRVTEVVEFVKRSSPSELLQVVDYLRAIKELHGMELGFEDIQFFFFKRKLNALLNLVGLHYCIAWLRVPAEHILEALLRHKILKRRVCVRWWKLGRWFYGFRMRDESSSRCVSLEDLTMEKGGEVLGVLRRGAIHEVFQVQISVADRSCTPWFCEADRNGV